MNNLVSKLICILLFMVYAHTGFAIELDDFAKVDIHGFISQGYLFTNHNNFYADTEGNGSTQFNEVGLNFMSNVSDRLRLGAQFFARDLGRMGNNDITVDWAYADYAYKNWLNIRAGRVKLPYGLYNMERDVDMLRTFIFLPQSFYNEGWRDSVNAMNGGGCYGFMPAGKVGNFSYEAYYGNVTLKPEYGVIRLLETAMPPEANIQIDQVDVDRTNAGTVTWDTIFGLDGLKLSASAYDVKMDCNFMANSPYIIPLIDISDPTNPTQVDSTTLEGMAQTTGANLLRIAGSMTVDNYTTAASLEYSWENMVFAAEVMQNDLTIEFPATPTQNTSYKTLGYYGSMTYRFTDWFEMGLAYSEYFANQDDKYGKKHIAADIAQNGYTTVLEQKQYQKDWTLALRFDVTANWIVKLEGHRVDGTSLLLADENPQDPVTKMPIYSRLWNLGALKVTYNF